MVELILSHGVDINRRDMFGMTALSYALKSGHHHIVKVLLRFGASPIRDGNSHYADQTEDAVILADLRRYRIVHSMCVMCGSRTKSRLVKNACRKMQL